MPSRPFVPSSPVTVSLDGGLPRLKPLAQIIALLMVAGGAQASQPFSAAWFAAKGAQQSAGAARPGAQLPGMTPPPLAQQQKVNQQLQRSLQNLNNTVAAIAAQQAVQAAGRQAALAAPTDIPDGLGEGGLKVDASLPFEQAWQNAKAPVQSQADGRTTVTVEQTADRAILNWETFNIGRQTTLQFDQQSNWAVLNRVNDPSARPSQIQGQIKADGTVMVANRNGVVFSGSSQVNVRNLVAAAASISDSQFRERGLYFDANGSQPSFTDAAGAVRVEQGALLQTANPASSTAAGGYVLLLGSEVENAGQIVTPKGQTTLAAGDSFYIRRGVGTDGNLRSTTRGNEVATSLAADSAAGRVVNQGLIQAATGDITLTGRQVRQEGVALSSSSTDVRGTIHLLNSASDARGSVVLGEGSTTAVLVDASGAGALDSQRDAAQQALDGTTPTNNVIGRFDNLSRVADRSEQSRVEIVSGGSVDFQGGSLTLASGGQVAVSAAGRSLLRDGAQVDVAGAVGVKVAMESNNIQINVQGNEQRDAPVNRDGGGLASNDVWVDARELVLVPAGTNGYATDRWYTAGGLLELGGYLGTRNHSAGEWMAQGGTLTFTGGELVSQPGSTVNLSGGTLDVQGGLIRQTWLKGSDGRLYEISRAPGDLLYEGIYRGYEDSSPRWGQTRYFYNPLIAPQSRYESGYMVGRDAGRLVVGTASAVLEGDLLGKVFQGERQVRAPQPGADGYQQAQNAVARGAELIVGSYTPRYESASGNVLYNLAPTLQQVRLADGGEPLAANLDLDTALADEQRGVLLLDSERLSGFELGALRVAARERIAVDNALQVGDGGEIVLYAPEVEVNADLTARAGSLRLGNVLEQVEVARGERIDTYLTPAAGQRAALTLGDGVTLDVRGLWSNQVQGGVDADRAYLDGGRISLRSSGDLSLGDGSRIDVSSGAALLADGKQVGGKGGDLTLSANTGSAAGDGRLQLGGELAGHGVAGAGTLSVQAPRVSIGAAAQDGTLALAAGFFDKGFASYQVIGEQGLEVAEGAQVKVLRPLYRFRDDAVSVASGADPLLALEPWLTPLYEERPADGELRQRPGASLFLQAGSRQSGAGQVADSVLDIGRGSLLEVDPGQRIELRSVGQLNVDGRLNAWGGSIELGSVALPDPVRDQVESVGHQRAIRVGEQGVLDVAARAATALDFQGRRYGQVADGGSIVIGGTVEHASGKADAAELFIDLRPGSLLDASGTQALLDVPGVGQTRVSSAGGSISLASANGLYLDGELRAFAGGEGAAAGSLTLALATPNYLTSLATDQVLRPRELIVGQQREAAGEGRDYAYGHGRLAASQVQDGGFGDLTLFSDGLLSFAGDLELSLAQRLRLYSGALGLGEGAAGDSRVRLSAPSLLLAGAFVNEAAENNETQPLSTGLFEVSRQPSEALFEASAQVLDIRDSLVFGSRGSFRDASGGTQTIDRRGFDRVELSSTGDMRLLAGNATPVERINTQVLSGGDLLIRAAQLYPGTGAGARILAGYGYQADGAAAAFDPARSLRIERSDATTPEQPLAVFGRLSLGAASVVQGGVVRAPLGYLEIGQNADKVELLSGSLTSVSGAGLTLPYGGTVDGQVWRYAGEEIALTGVGGSFNERGIMDTGVDLGGRSVRVASGATLDLSGGGELLGAGFVSGRGGSTDARYNPLVRFDEEGRFDLPGLADNPIYAIVPGVQRIAPVAAEGGAVDPLVGQQISIGSGVPGLSAGTYTLLPSTYALLPGAYRVELNGQAGLGRAAPTQLMRSGSWSLAGQLSLAGTGVRDELFRQVLLTPADVLRRHSQYNETSYSDFAMADAARRGIPRPMLPVDARSLRLDLLAGGGADALAFDGTGLFQAARGGYGGSLVVLGNNQRIEIVGAGAQASEGFQGVTLRADDLNAFGAARMVIGSTPAVLYGQGGNYVTFDITDGAQSIVLRNGAELAAPEVFLLANRPGEAISLEQGAAIVTLGRGAAAYDARDGFLYASGGRSMLALSNGVLNVLPPEAGTPDSGPGDILLGVPAADGVAGETRLYSEGSLVAATDKRFVLDGSVRYGTRNLTLAAGGFNVGEQALLAELAERGVLPTGLALDQQVLDRLLQGDASEGAPPLETLVLNARDAFNFYGDVSLDSYDPSSGRSRLSRLVLGTPAIYGYGDSDSVASIRTSNLIWNGAQTPAAGVITGGAGSGQGTLDIRSERLEFGYGPFSQPSAIDSYQRLALGFATVNLAASERITANHKGSLAVYQSQGEYRAGSGYAYSGGDLNLITPLLTGEAGSRNSLLAGGALRVSAGGGGAASTPVELANGALGAELALEGASLLLDTRVGLPSGKLSLTAQEDLELGAGAQLDLAGRALRFDDVIRYSWGGEVNLLSHGGNIRQAGASRIDLSASNNQAGSLTAVALDSAAGVVDLQGQILAASSGEYDAGGTLVPYAAGSVEIRAQRLGEDGTPDSRFAALNQRLNAGQVFGARSFQIKQGDLNIGNDVRASTIEVSLDGGHLSVNGVLDASGEQVGSIRLAAKQGLSIGGEALLDAHGRRLRVDSYGKIIDSPNRALIELNAGDGLLSLGAGARIDLRHGTEAAAGSAPGQNDGVARGTLDLYAPRLGGATAGDIAIDAGAPLQILGARAITLSAVQRYDDAPVAALPASNGRPYQEITQAYLDGKHQQSELFMQAALANSALLDGKLAGLNNATYAEAFHLRPGLEIVSATADGDLVVQGDLDLSGHRYASLNPRTAKTSVYGSGEAGSLAIRAGGDLNIYGSVTDGFAPPPETDDDQGWLLLAGQDHLGGDRVVPTAGVRLDDDSFFPAGKTLNFELPIKAMTLAAGTRLPVEAVLSQPLQLPAGTVLEGALLDAAGNLLRPAGSLLGEALDLPAGTRLGAGSRLPLATPVTGMTWPGGVPLPGRATLANDEVDGVRLAGGLALRAGAFLPAGSDIRLPDGAASVDVRPAGAVSHNWAIAPMLAAGSQSWSVRLVAGADLQAADPRLTDPRSSGQMRLADTHYGMRRIPAAGGGLVWTQEGVDNWGDPSLKPGDPLDPEALGYPTICDDFPTWCAASSGGMVWTEEGVAGWGDPGIKPGDPLDPEALGYPTICDDFPTWCAASSDDYALEAEPYASRFSVLRTGTGDLDLFAAGNLRMDSPFGVYTAGTASAVDSSYNLPRARDGGSVLRDPALGGYEQWVDGGEQSLYSAWYPTLGGNLTLAVGGDLRGDVLGRLSGAVPNAGYDSAAVGNWLWRQGSGSTAGTADATAWWINFGTYARQPGGDGAAAATQQLGFTGIGTLGGGDLSLKVAGDAGVIEARTSSVPQETSQRSQGLVLAVGGSGRVGADGQLTLSGGGDMDVRIGGALNPLMPFDQGSSLYGAMVNLRGNAQVRATSLGGIDLNYGRLDSQQVPGERRAYDPFVSTLGLANGGPTLVPGDATFSLNSLGDLVLQGVVDPGRTPLMNGTPYTSASGVEGYGLSGFSLWTERTAIDLTSAGGNLTPVSQGRTEQDTDSALVYPAKLSAVALTGSLYYGNATLPENARSDRTALVLAPSSQGRLDLLAGDSIYAGGYSISRSGASTGSLATPLNPSYQGYTGITRQVDNLSSDGSRADTNHFPLFAFGANSVSGEWGAALEPSRFYALAGDLVGVDSGRLLRYTGTSDVRFGQLRYEGHGAVRMIAGRDIVSSGTGLGSERTASDNMGVYASSGNLFVNTSATDVSLVQAGRDILYGNFNVAGPGSLEISAGRNLLMNDEVAVTSLGAVAAGDTRSGASIVLQAGASQAGYSGFLRRYLELDNLAQAGTPLAEQPGKVVRTYENELIEWLSGRYGFSGDAQQAREFLAGLSAEQQRIFAREVYFAELKAGGREYNEVGGVRQGSYLRGRNAIAALFPERDPAGNPISYEGDIVMYGGAGVHTNFGGDIQLLTPGGQQVFGIEGEAPPSTAGVVTQGVGNIRSYALSSILLGQSRVMTTFGGDIQIWSAEGDINAGRGSKTTVVYTPPRRIYDAWGNVSLSPQVPSTGAGIATLNPIPEVAPGDIDLIAPLGTIDAGEAGIRVSGNVNVAALQVVNAANIQTQGQSSGIPLVASVNTGALTSASAAASSATQAAEDVSRQQQAAARQRMPSVITVQVLGFGNERLEPSRDGASRSPGYNPDSAVQVLGAGALGEQARSQLTDEERGNLIL
ncbi:TPA: filamentous hemagglutinin N-terminal domain-containing protein [Pseudomonas aeruginosa]|uniref:filamentous hemagglutinin family protein n=1 Tax=Pseudomonas aeruginosa TaxID=287 RepID=UPI00053D72DD|nr:filamentous hemagglutinin family protein [Pseudomonas aeruginosa]MBH9070243.1 filamentous hemagglutinin family protein [Pseudomonas aeruginosa]RTV91330.1 filamentous hemagglutinin N-terminal domain-containing protein [Pseudomonas aeruginosa]HBO9441203.1 filamentous hemagglutinin N-terminal domain-containing protein [Pseudomonas aeruginosa]HBO9515338.1 filamentous hemagglutinin N-terminal domain-containing protein [Pseudomonas aeruginosa]HBO9657069.1 filamentous hemagglutinin N-terminal doma